MREQLYSQMAGLMAKRRELKARWQKATANPLSEAEFVDLVNSVIASGEIPEEYVVAFPLGERTVSFRFIEKQPNDAANKADAILTKFWPSWVLASDTELAMANEFYAFAKRHGWSVDVLAHRVTNVYFEKFNAVMF